MARPERVLVTGGAGFIGSHASEYYAERDVEVTAVDNLSRVETLATADESRDTSAHNWRYLDANYPSVELVEADIRDFEAVVELVEGHDAIVHTAGQVAVTSSLEDPRADFSVNAAGTLNVLEAARLADSDPAVVFASTNKVYGNNVNDIQVVEEATRYRFEDAYSSGIPETFDVDGCEHTPYGVSKLAADLYLQDYVYRGQLDGAAFRMSCVYGPRQFGNEDQGWVAHFILSTLRDTGLTIFGDGKQVRDVLYVKDLIRAYDRFLSEPGGKPPVYNIGGGPERTTSLLEFLDLLEASTTQRTAVEYDDWREGDQKVYVSDIQRASEQLDWEPKVSFDEGVERYLDWYEDSFEA